MLWIEAFTSSAAASDRFGGRADHIELLAAGLLGETGSLLAEFKKAERDRNAYPEYLERLHEEFGDVLWYLTRLTALTCPTLLPAAAAPSDTIPAARAPLTAFLDVGVAAGDVLRSLGTSRRARRLPRALGRMWATLREAAALVDVSLSEAAEANQNKTRSRWPVDRAPSPLFDDLYPPEEQLPRLLRVDFIERTMTARQIVVLRCNDLNFGDRVSDNIADPDAYRFHDIFHFSHAVHLGWSPVVRALLRCKRKSNAAVDETEDGARAVVVEEAITAIIFSRAKRLNYFDGVDQVDYDLLKLIAQLTRGFEVDRVPLWQWEESILVGYRIFRHLRQNHGGRVLLDLRNRHLSLSAR
jgi:NTP pyrophosphatase (non-canonical NTP hydrolase)